MSISKSDLLNRPPGVAHRQNIDGLGEVCIREISGEDFDFVSKKTKDGEIDERQMFARLVVVGLCDEAGKREFTNGEVDTVNKKIPFHLLKQLAELIQKHSGINPDDVDTDAGNSEPTTPDVSGTD